MLHTLGGSCLLKILSGLLAVFIHESQQVDSFDVIAEKLHFIRVEILNEAAAADS